MAGVDQVMVCLLLHYVVSGGFFHHWAKPQEIEDCLTVHLPHEII